MAVGRQAFLDFFSEKVKVEGQPPNVWKPVTVGLLVEELDYITDRYELSALGESLGIGSDKLHQIYQAHDKLRQERDKLRQERDKFFEEFTDQLQALLLSTSERSKDDMKAVFTYWLENNSTVSWGHVIRALKEIGQTPLAMRISTKYVKTIPAAPTLQSLEEELETIADWQGLGLRLGIQEHKLREIEVNSHGEMVACWRMMLSYWLKSTPNSSWDDVIAALVKMKEWTTAAKLKFIYEHQTSNSAVTWSNSTGSVGSSVSAAKPTHSAFECIPISDWLSSYKMPQYVPLLMDSGYDNTDFLLGITVDELAELGIAKVGHRKRIVSALSHLLPKKHLLTFKPASVAEWLQQLGLSQYETVVIESGYDAIDFITTVTEEELADIGITKQGHLKRFKKGIKELCDMSLSEPPTPSFFSQPFTHNLQSSPSHSISNISSYIQNMEESSTQNSMAIGDAETSEPPNSDALPVKSDPAKAEAGETSSNNRPLRAGSSGPTSHHFFQHRVVVTEKKRHSRSVSVPPIDYPTSSSHSVLGVQPQAGITAERILQKRIVTVTEVVKTNLNHFNNRLKEKFLVAEGLFDPDDKMMKKAECASALYSACMTAVKVDSSKFSVVINILKEYPLLEQTVQEMEKEGIEAGIMKAIPPVQGGVPPNQSGTDMSDDQSCIVDCSEETLVKLEQLEAEHAAMLFNVKKQFRKRTDTKKFVEVVSNFLKDAQIGRSPKSFDDTFCLLEQHLDTFNNHTLHCVATTLKNSRVLQLVSDYNKKMNEFLTNTKVRDFQRTIQQRADSQSDTFLLGTIQLKLKGRWPDRTLKDVNDLVNNIFGIRAKAFIKPLYQKGCVLVSWLLPSSWILQNSFLVSSVSLCRAYVEDVDYITWLFEEHNPKNLLFGEQLCFSSSELHNVPFQDPDTPFKDLNILFEDPNIPIEDPNTPSEVTVSHTLQRSGSLSSLTSKLGSQCSSLASSVGSLVSLGSVGP